MCRNENFLILPPLSRRTPDDVRFYPPLFFFQTAARAFILRALANTLLPAGHINRSNVNDINILNFWTSTETIYIYIEEEKKVCDADIETGPQLEESRDLINFLGAPLNSRCMNHCMHRQRRVRLNECFTRCTVAEGRALKLLILESFLCH